MFQRAFRWLLVPVAALVLLAGCGDTPSAVPTLTATTVLASPTLPPEPTATTMVATTPAPVEGRAVTFPTEDANTQLQGTLYGKNGVAIIFSNMGAQRQETWEPAARRMAERGYMVLTYNMRYWVSETQTQGSLRSKAGDDLRAAVAFARSQGARDIVLVGASLGGMATAKVAAAEKPLAVVIMASPLGASGLDFKVDEAEVQAIAAPKLFIYSQDENPDIRAGAQQMYDLSPQPKELYVYPGTAHGTELFDTEHRDDLLNRLQSFIEQNAPVRQ